MIITIDGVEKKRGDKAWEISRSLTTGNIIPSLTRMTGKERNGEGRPNFWNDYNLCVEQCNLMNNDNNK